MADTPKMTRKEAADYLVPRLKRDLCRLIGLDENDHNALGVIVIVDEHGVGISIKSNYSPETIVEVLQETLDNIRDRNPDDTVSDNGRDH